MHDRNQLLKVELRLAEDSAMPNGKPSLAPRTLVPNAVVGFVGLLHSQLLPTAKALFRLNKKALLQQKSNKLGRWE